MNVCCVFSLESPHQGHSNEYTQYTIFNIKKKITLNYPKIAAIRFFPRDSGTSLSLRIEPSVFEPVKVPKLQLYDFFQGTQEQV